MFSQLSPPFSIKWPRGKKEIETDREREREREREGLQFLKMQKLNFLKAPPPPEVIIPMEKASSYHSHSLTQLILILLLGVLDSAPVQISLLNPLFYEKNNKRNQECTDINDKWQARTTMIIIIIIIIIINTIDLNKREKLPFQS